MAKKRRNLPPGGQRVLSAGRKRVLVVLFIPSVERDGVSVVDQSYWVDSALQMFGRAFGGATAFAKLGRAKSAWSLATSTSRSAISLRSDAMKMRLDMDKIARKLGAERQGKVASAAGYFGAVQLVAEVQARFRTPAGGGRPTDSRWTERRLVPLTPRTLKRLEEIAGNMRTLQGVSIEPMQVAALLLEKKTEEVSDREAANLARSKEHAGP